MVCHTILWYAWGNLYHKEYTIQNQMFESTMLLYASCSTNLATPPIFHDSFMTHKCHLKLCNFKTFIKCPYKVAFNAMTFHFLLTIIPFTVK